MTITLYKARRFLCLITVASLIIAMCGCSAGTGKALYLSDPVTVTDFKLNTYVSVASYTTGGYSTSQLKDVLKEALALCDTYELMFSRTKPKGNLYRLNSGETDTVPEDLGLLIETGLKYSQLSQGALDITIGSVSSLWDFTASDPKVPEQERITEALSSVNYNNVTLTRNEDSSYTVTSPPGTVIDLGAIAKGYIADRIKEFLLEKGINQAIINLGGNVLCVGSKKDNSSFNIAVKKPFSENESLETLKITDKSVVSSGNYERYFYEEDVLYHHILNPATGYPVDNGLSDVTIVSDDSLIGDCLSTTCFALGLTEGLKLIENTPGVEAMFVEMNGNITCSSGFSQYRCYIMNMHFGCRRAGKATDKNINKKEDCHDTYYINYYSAAHCICIKPDCLAC